MLKEGDYSEQEVDWLNRHQHMTLREMASYLNRTYNSVRDKVYRLGLSYKKQKKVLSKSEIGRCHELFSKQVPIYKVAEYTCNSYSIINNCYKKWFEIQKDKLKRNEAMPVYYDKQLYWERESEIFASIRPEYKEEDLTGEEKGILTLIKKGEIKL